MIETLFVVKPPNASKSSEKLTVNRPIFPSSVNQESQVLDPKKSQNISIALRAFNVTIEEVCDALLEGDFLHSLLTSRFMSCFYNYNKKYVLIYVS